MYTEKFAATIVRTDGGERRFVRAAAAVRAMAGVLVWQPRVMDDGPDGVEI